MDTKDLIVIGSVVFSVIFHIFLKIFWVRKISEEGSFSTTHKILSDEKLREKFWNKYAKISEKTFGYPVRLNEVGTPIDWDTGKSAIQLFAKLEGIVHEPVYVEYDYSKFIEFFQPIYNLKNSSESKIIPMKIRAYFSTYVDPETRKVYRSMVFVPAFKHLNSKVYTDYKDLVNKTIFDLGVPCPPDCESGRKYQGNESTGAIMAREAYGPLLHCCLSVNPSACTDCR